MDARPQKEHEWLQQLVGTWSYEVESPTEPGKPAERHAGTETVRSLDGIWFLAEGRGDMPGGGTATTLMTLGYDPQRKRYVGTWIGSMMAYLWVYDGELEPSGKALALSSDGPRMDGTAGTTQYRDVIEIESHDRRRLIAHVRAADGTWQQLMTAVYRRTG